MSRNSPLSYSHTDPPSPHSLTPPTQHDPYEPQIPKDDTPEKPKPDSRPPSPEDTESLSLNFANLTPIELPPKPKSRKISVYSEASDLPSPQVDTQNPFGEDKLQSDSPVMESPTDGNPFGGSDSPFNRKRAPAFRVGKDSPSRSSFTRKNIITEKKEALTSNPFEDDEKKPESKLKVLSPALSPFDDIEDSKAASAPQPVAEPTTNPFNEPENINPFEEEGKNPFDDDADNMKSSRRTETTPTSLKSSLLGRVTKKSRAPPVPTAASTPEVAAPEKKSEFPETPVNPKANDKKSTEVVEEEAAAARRRSSVPALPAGLRKSEGSSYEMSRSQSGTGLSNQDLFPRLGAAAPGSPTTRSSRVSLDPHDSPRSTHSGASSRGAASGATASLCSLREEGASLGIGVRSGAMVRGGSVKEKRCSQPLEDEWERKLCGRRSSE